MTTDEVLQPLETWLEPASMGITSAVLDAHRAAAVALSTQATPKQLLLASFERILPADLAILEPIVSAVDPNYQLGSSALLSRIAGAAAMVVLDSDTDRSLELALYVQSALFAGLTPVLEELIPTAGAAIETSAIRARERPTKRTVLKPAAAEADLPTEVAFSNNVLKRADADYDDLSHRLTLMDEEINFLWWARSDSTKDGIKWTDVANISRAFIAAREVGQLIVNVSSTAKARSLMAQRVDPENSKQVALADLEGENLTVAAPSVNLIRPIGSVAKTYVDFPDSAEARTAILSKEGIDRDRKVSLRLLAQQILVESTIERLGHGND